ncbi:hypothetical protein NQ318_004208 [Aromia moschata]|uniref:Major facilitator superfamily (MFS) profile domain-containing protein n=1 Tax=Aromia moschata TaxID=1265417 RepID=A0AAV8Y6J7_9CUCU|nr:hypothetical protein NQ318_004208 [Aromia moschata]
MNNSSSFGFQTYPEWSDHKNVMLSTFFWGYVCTQLVGAFVAERFGPKWFLAVTVFITSLFSMLIPVFGSEFGYKGIITCRVIQGLGEGLLFPCLQHLLGKWAPLKSRSKASAITYSGTALGILVSMPLTGLICNSKSLGWPVAYYLFGAIGMLWVALWSIFGSDCPLKHKSISESEKSYICSNLEAEFKEENFQKRPAPWISIITSFPFWAILINDCGYSWGCWTLLTEIPSYMQNVLNFDIASNSLLSTLPYLFATLSIYPMGFLSDLLLARKTTSVTVSRKIFNSIAIFGNAICLFSLTFVDVTQRVETIVVLVIGAAFTGGIFSGYLINQIDLAPNYAGSIMGVSNTAANFFLYGFILATGLTENDKALWTYIFCTASGILLAVGLLFIFAGSAEVQPWNNYEYKRKTREKRKN